MQPPSVRAGAAGPSVLLGQASLPAAPTPHFAPPLPRLFVEAGPRYGIRGRAGAAMTQTHGQPECQTCSRIDLRKIWIRTRRALRSRLSRPGHELAARAWATLHAPGPPRRAVWASFGMFNLGLSADSGCFKLLVCCRRCLRMFPAFAVPPPLRATTEGTSSPLQSPRGLQRLQSLSGSVGRRRESRR